MATKSKKKARKAGASTVTHIYYECQGNSCLESINQANVGNSGSVVVLSAIETDVTLDFSPYSGSPFKGRKKKVTIKADKSKHMVVDQGVVQQAYTYNLACDKCTGPRPPAPPSMIVP